MHTTIEARKLDFELPAELEAELAGRLDQLSHRYSFVEAAHVVLSRQRGFYTTEVTLQVKHQILRAQERSNDVGSSIDSVLGKLERQLHRHKGRLHTRSRADSRELPELIEYQPEEPEEAFEEPRVVRVKRIAVKPMSAQEAALQMDLLGHDFYVFRNDETDELNVVYRRHNGDFGLIQPE